MGPVSLEPAGPLRVLVVDDYDDARDSLCMLLRIWGCHAEPAADGPQALAATDAFRPHVVLMELALPGMDGYETARRLQELPQPPLLVALTTCARDEDRRTTRRAGFAAHVVKPADPTDLPVLLGRAAGLFRLARAAASGAVLAVVEKRPGEPTSKSLMVDGPSGRDRSEADPISSWLRGKAATRPG